MELIRVLLVLIGLIGLGLPIAFALVAVVYGILVSTLYYRTLTLRNL